MNARNTTRRAARKLLAAVERLLIEAGELRRARNALYGDRPKARKREVRQELKGVADGQ